MKTILVPIDFSDVTVRVLETAQQFARSFGSRIVLLHVAEPEPDLVGFEPGPQTVRVSVAHDMRVEHQQLEKLKQELVDAGFDTIALNVQGPTSEKIIREAATLGAELIVVGSHGHGALYELFVGSVTSGVLKHAPCPVLVVPARGKK